MYCYLFPHNTRINTLKKITSTLTDDGCVVILTSKRTCQKGWTIRVAQATASLTGNPHPPETGDWVGSDLALEHVFTQEEIATEATEAGLQLVTFNTDRENVSVLKKT